MGIEVRLAERFEGELEIVPLLNGGVDLFLNGMKLPALAADLHFDPEHGHELTVTLAVKLKAPNAA